MSYNKVFFSQSIKSILTKAGGSLKLEYATKTSAWERLYLAQQVQDDFTRAMENTTDIPDNAVTAVLAETEHPSSSDSKSHFTTAFQDANGNHLTTKHVYPQS